MSKNKIIILSIILYLICEIHTVKNPKRLIDEAKKDGKSFVYQDPNNLINNSLFQELEKKIKNEKFYTISLFIINEIYDEKNFLYELDTNLHFHTESNYIVLVYLISKNERKIFHSTHTSKLNPKCFDTVNSKIKNLINEDSYLIKLIDNLIENKDFCSKKSDNIINDKKTSINLLIPLLIIIFVIIIVLFCYVLNKMYKKSMNEAMGIPNGQYQNMNYPQENYPQAQPRMPQTQNSIIHQLPIISENNNNNDQTPNDNYQPNQLNNNNNNYQTPNVNYQPNQLNNNNYQQNQTPNVNYQPNQFNYNDYQQNQFNNINQQQNQFNNINQQQNQFNNINQQQNQFNTNNYPQYNYNTQH